MRNCANFTEAREAYQKFITLSSDGKEIEAVKKKIAELPQEPRQPKNDRQDRGPDHLRFEEAAPSNWRVTWWSNAWPPA